MPASFVSPERDVKNDSKPSLPERGHGSKTRFEYCEPRLKKGQIGVVRLTRHERKKDLFTVGRCQDLTNKENIPKKPGAFCLVP